MFVGVEQHNTFAGLDFHRHDLFLEATLGNGDGSTAMAFGGQCILLRARNVVARGHVLGRDTHVHLFPRVMQDAQHVVHQCSVTHAHAITGRGVEVGAATHGFRAAADGDVAIAQGNGLRCRYDGLQARAAQAVDIEGGGLDRAAGINGGDAAQIGVLGVSGNHIAHHHMANGIRSHATAFDGGAHSGGGELGVGHVFERTAEGADGGAGGADDEDVALGHGNFSCRQVNVSHP